MEAPESPEKNKTKKASGKIPPNDNPEIQQAKLVLEKAQENYAKAITYDKFLAREVLLANENLRNIEKKVHIARLRKQASRFSHVVKKECDMNLIYLHFLENPEAISTPYESIHDLRNFFNYLAVEPGFSRGGFPYRIEYADGKIYVGNSDKSDEDLKSDESTKIYDTQNPTEWNAFISFITPLIQPGYPNYFGAESFPFLPLANYGKMDTVIGAGSFGEVYALNPKYVLKKIDKDEMKEIVVMGKMYHPNITQLDDVIFLPDEDSLGLVIPRAAYDLAVLIKNDFIDSTNIDKYAGQLIQAFIYLQRVDVWHCDPKPQNILYYPEEDLLKIADFGISRSGTCSSELKRYSTYIYTLWYRPIEILMEDNKRNIQGDFWSLGCILAEMVLRKPLFALNDENDVIHWIFKLLGDPLRYWPAINGYEEFTTNKEVQIVAKKYAGKPNNLLEYLLRNKTFPVSDLLLETIVSLIAYPPQRISEIALLKSRYVQTLTIDPCTTAISSDCEFQRERRTLLFGDPFPRQIDLTKHMFNVLMNWLNEVRSYFNETYEVYFLCYSITVYYLSALSNRGKNLPRSRLQLVGCVAYFIASSEKGISPTSIEDLTHISSKSFTEADMAKMIEYVSRVLSFNFDLTTAYDYLVGKTDNLARFFLFMLSVNSDIFFEHSPRDIANTVDYIFRLSEKKPLSILLMKSEQMIINLPTTDKVEMVGGEANRTRWNEILTRHRSGNLRLVV